MPPLRSPPGDPCSGRQGIFRMPPSSSFCATSAEGTFWRRSLIPSLETYFPCSPGGEEGFSPSLPSEVLSETEPGLPDCDRPPRPQHTGTVRRGDPLAAVLELPGQTGSQVACMTFKAQLSTVSCGEALQGPLREPTATLLLVQILCSPHSQAVDSHPRVCLLLCRNHTSRRNWLLNPKVLVLPLLLVGSERRPFSRDLQSTECLEPGLLTQP